MNIQIQANIQLTQADIRAALAQYVSQNGFDLEGKTFDMQGIPETVSVVVDSADVTSAMPKATLAKAEPKAKAEKKAEPSKPVETKTTVSQDTQQDEDTQVPANDVAEYRAKKQAEEQAKKAAEAKAKAEADKALKKAEAEAEAERVAAEEATASKAKSSERNAEDIFADTIDEDDDGPQEAEEAVVERKPVAITRNVFDDPEDDAPVGDEDKVPAKNSKSIFD